MPWNVHLPDAEYYKLDDEKLDGIIREVCDEKEVALDTETTGLTVWKDVPLFWSLAWGNRRVCMPASTMPAFQKAFADSQKRWIFANAKYDLHMLANVGHFLTGKIIDTQVMHALIYEEQPHDLKSMALQVLGWRWNDFFDTFKPMWVTDWEGKNGRKETIGEMLLRFERTDLNKLVEYASNDAYGTLRIYRKLKEELERETIFGLYPNQYANMADIFFKVEMPFTRVLFNCERHGIKLDIPFLQSIEKPVREDLNKLERRINQLAGRPLNPNSPLQLREYFFNELKVRPVGLSKGGKSGVRNPSVDSTFLEYYKNDVEMAGLLLQHRDLSKLLGTYIEGLQERVDPKGRVHTRFNQDVARTGRLSSSDPNLQNIKSAEDDPYELRRAFVAEEGYELIVVDYEQLEMRLLAAAAMEPKMIGIFESGRDIHMGNAALVFGKMYGITYDDIQAAKKKDKKVKEGQIPPEAMLKKDHDCLFARRAAKAIGFGLNYGMKENKMAKDLGISPEEALEYINEYKATYPAVDQFYAEAIAETQQSGYAFTLLGRRRFLPEIHSLRADERWGAERKAVNNQIQGTAADACRLAMLHCHFSNLEGNYGCRMLLQVHDELIFECPKGHVDEVKEIIRDCMEHPFPTDLAVALPVSMGSGPNWLKAK